MVSTGESPRQTLLTLRTKGGAFLELVRIRIALLVLFATGTGYALALRFEDGTMSLAILAHALLGTAMVAAGSNTLNQVIESERDRLMTRTVNRPLPSGRLTHREALVFGLLAGLGGVYQLVVSVNVLTGVIGLVTFASYVLLYTPMKTRTWRSVFVGAVPGALPPVIGWTAATGTISTPVLSLFLIVFIWQLPHFAGIAWLHRKDYGRAGFPVLPVVDAEGRRFCRHLLGFSWVLLAVSLLPVWCRLTGAFYGLAAVGLGLVFIGFGMAFTHRLTRRTARSHLLSSVLYLPLLFGAMLIDKAW